MPTYEYVCGQCSDRFEIFQSIKDAPLTECAKCGGPVKRVFSAGAGIIFKGSGFYATDNKGKSGSVAGAATKTDTAETAAPAADTAGVSEAAS